MKATIPPEATGPSQAAGRLRRAPRRLRTSARCLLCVGLLAAATAAGCAGAPPVAYGQAERAYHQGPAAAARAFEFALIANLPYHGFALDFFDALVAQVNADAGIVWVLHAGDIKSGSSSCADRALLDRRARFDRFQRPFLLTPGDNDWSDCHRAGAGGFAPLERLARLRQIFYPRPGYTLGVPVMPVTTQAAAARYAEFPENVRWVRDNVVFAALHIVGSWNASQRFAGRSAADDAEVARRTDAALVWLRETFAVAERRGSPGVFLLVHANPAFGARPGSRAARAYGSFLGALEREVIRFGRPVLLAHGDTHRFRYDQPLVRARDGAPIANFWRVEAPGGHAVGWVRVRVMPASPGVFSVRRESMSLPQEADALR